MFSCLFFFKQKTAYEMRISDWSSDVCSSDLRVPLLELGLYGARDTYWTWRVRVCQQHELWLMPDDEPDGNEPDEEREMIRLQPRRVLRHADGAQPGRRRAARVPAGSGVGGPGTRGGRRDRQNGRAHV